LTVALCGHDDARGFRQWESVGRHVKKGQKGFPILVPLTKKVQTDGEDPKFVAYGFKNTVVFGYEQTDGKALPERTKTDQFIDSLPLLDVAKSWGLSVQTFSNAEKARYAGFYRHGSAIALGVENLATWSHELMHAADDRLGNLTERGQHWRSEIVAELGGAILLRCIGHEMESDVGGCWDYVNRYARDAKVAPLVACQRVLKRTCEAVSLILKTADELQTGQTERGAA